MKKPVQYCESRGTKARCYPTQNAAYNYARLVRLQIYPCDVCGLWHVGKKQAGGW